MATFVQRCGPGGKWVWRAMIRRKGYAVQSATFDTRIQARDWAEQIEAEMGRGTFVARTEAEATTLTLALDRYAVEVSSRKVSADREKYFIRSWRATPLAARHLAAIRGHDIAEWVRAREAQGLSANTIRLHLALLSHLFNTARTAWGMESLSNPVELVKGQRPKLPPGRTRRLEGDEEARLLANAGLGFAPVIRWALATAMRRGEIAGLRWEHVDTVRRSAHLPETKNGHARSVPLSREVLAILAEIPRGPSGSVFGMTDNAITLAMKKACPKAGIKGLTFHDLRHEAISRLFERADLDAMEIARISGHRTLSMLSRYTHLRAHKLADRMDGVGRG